MAEISMEGVDGGADDNAQPISADSATDAEGGQSDLLQGILADIAAEEGGKSAKPAKAPKEKAEAAPVTTHEEAEESEEEESPEEDEAPPPPKKKFKAKANGKEYEYDEDQLPSVLSRGLAAQQNWDKAKSEIEAMRREIEAERAEAKKYRQEIESNPEKFLRQHKAVAEKLLQEEAEEWFKLQQLPPEARQEYQARKAAEAKLREYEEKQKAFEAESHKQLVVEQKKQLETFLSEGLKAHSLPANTLTLRIMAGIVQAHAAESDRAAKEGRRIPELSIQKVGELARKQLREVLTNSYGPESVDAFVADNPKLAEAVRDYYVKKAKQPPAELEDVAPRAPTGQFVKRKASSKPKEADPFAEIEKFKRDAEKERAKNGW